MKGGTRLLWLLAWHLGISHSWCPPILRVWRGEGAITSHVLSRPAVGTDVVEPAHPWECAPPPIPSDTDVSECLRSLPGWCPRMWCQLRREPLVRWGLEVGQCTLSCCVVHLPAQGTKVDCWTCCLPYQCCRLDTRMECVPSHMVGSIAT